MNIYEKFFRALNKSRIKYVVVGGVAVNLYGYRRFTGDIDILLALDEGNLKKMDLLMKKLGYIERLPISLHSLSDKGQVKKWLKEKGMTAFTFISNKKIDLDLDILVEKSLYFMDFYENRTVIEAWGIKIPVVSIKALIKMKKEAGRDQDLLDLKNLLKYK